MESHNQKTIAKYHPLFFGNTHICITFLVYTVEITKRTNMCSLNARKTKSSEINPKYYIRYILNDRVMLYIIVLFCIDILSYQMGPRKWSAATAAMTSLEKSYIRRLVGRGFQHHRRRWFSVLIRSVLFAFSAPRPGGPGKVRPSTPPLLYTTRNITKHCVYSV